MKCKGSGAPPVVDREGVARCERCGRVVGYRQGCDAARIHWKAAEDHDAPPSRQCFLLVLLDVSAAPATAVGAGVFSDERPTTFGARRWATLEEGHGPDFATAAAELVDRVKTEKRLAWLLALPSRDWTSPAAAPTPATVEDDDRRAIFPHDD